MRTAKELRTAFEAWITASPYEECVERVPNDEEKYAWHGCYKSVTVHLAWDAWQAAAARYATVREDDDQPLDAAWLDTISPRCSDGVVSNWFFGVTVTVQSHRETADAFMVKIGSWGQPHIKTRGQLRNLLSALGIDLKQTA